ncbi:MAG: hypothetical protein HC908_04260 [Calothrix sp. SM1_7_51]|nr:hypothetical protein [Calothrix sp. SM1_7_51]
MAGCGLTAAILATIPMGDKPAIARLVDAGTEIAQNVLQQPKLVLNLAAHQQQMQKDALGKETVNWKALDSNITVKPGDVIRFTVTGKMKVIESQKVWL